jgi:hypothetical protein
LWKEGEMPDLDRVRKEKLRREAMDQKFLGLELTALNEEKGSLNPDEIQGILNEGEDENKTALKKIENEMGRFTSISVATTTEQEEQELQAVRILNIIYIFKFSLERLSRLLLIIFVIFFVVFSLHFLFNFIFQQIF